MVEGCYQVNNEGFHDWPSVLTKLMIFGLFSCMGLMKAILYLLCTENSPVLLHRGPGILQAMLWNFSCIMFMWCRITTIYCFVASWCNKALSILIKIGWSNGLVHEAPSHYLNQYWLIICKILKNIFQSISVETCAEIIPLKWESCFPGTNEFLVYPNAVGVEVRLWGLCVVWQGNLSDTGP